MSKTLGGDDMLYTNVETTKTRKRNQRRLTEVDWDFPSNKY